MRAFFILNLFDVSDLQISMLNKYLTTIYIA